MGVYRYDYLVLGWKLNQDILEEDFCEDLQYDVPDNFFFPEDGEFAVFGKLITMSDYITGFELLEMNTEKTVMWLEDYDKLTSTFRKVTENELLDWVEHEQAKLYLFSILQ
jgi:hypothetical protein